MQTYLHSIRFVYDLVLLTIFFGVAITLFLEWRKETSKTGFQRWIAAAKDSETILWSKFVYLLAAVTGQLDNIADFLGQPELKDFINSWVGNPQVISAIMLVIAFITIRARMRPSSSDPVK